MFGFIYSKFQLFKTAYRGFYLLIFLVLIGCSSYSLESPVLEKDIAALSAAIRNLSPNITQDEANRAARIAYEYPRQLAVQYGITDPPLIHNFKVNSGVRPRGLCYHWADDLEARLRKEGFQTLTLHRALANAQNAILIEHSTVIISANGDSFEQGIVLDPWRHGGVLFWSPTLKDSRYHWLQREAVFAQRRNRHQSK